MPDTAKYVCEKCNQPVYKSMWTGWQHVEASLIPKHKVEPKLLETLEDKVKKLKRVHLLGVVYEVYEPAWGTGTSIVRLPKGVVYKGKRSKCTYCGGLCTKVEENGAWVHHMSADYINADHEAFINKDDVVQWFQLDFVPNGLFHTMSTPYGSQIVKGKCSHCELPISEVVPGYWEHANEKELKLAGAEHKQVPFSASIHVVFSIRGVNCYSYDDIIFKDAPDKGTHTKVSTNVAQQDLNQAMLMSAQMLDAMKKNLHVNQAASLTDHVKLNQQKIENAMGLIDKIQKTNGTFTKSKDAPAEYVEFHSWEDDTDSTEDPLNCSAEAYEAFVKKEGATDALDLPNENAQMETMILWLIDMKQKHGSKFTFAGPGNIRMYVDKDGELVVIG